MHRNDWTWTLNRTNKISQRSTILPTGVKKMLENKPYVSLLPGEGNKQYSAQSVPMEMNSTLRHKFHLSLNPVRVQDWQVLVAWSGR